MLRNLLLTCLLAGCVAGAQAQDASTQKLIHAVENNLMPYVPVHGFAGWNITERMKYYGVPGVSIAVIKDYKIHWAKGYGLADTLNKKPVTVTTMFSAGSISKLVAAVAAFELVEHHTLALDSPINRYLTSWKIADNDFTRKKPVTLRMLLSHTGGTSQSSYFGFTPDKRPLPSVVEILSGAPSAETRAVVVNSEPGKEFRYSGGGSMIAQLAMMDVTGTNFSNLTDELIFKKLGMNNSTFEQPVPPRYAAQTAWAYSTAPWFKGMPYVYPQQAAAGLYTTPTDLAKVIIDLQKSLRGKGKLLTRESATHMMTAQASVSSGGYREEIGIGPFLLQRVDNQEPEGIYFEFTGVNAGFLAYAIGSLQDGNGVVIMMNSGDDVNGLGKEIRRSVASCYRWHNFLPEKIFPIEQSEHDLDRYAGRYRKGPDEVVYIRRERNYLVENINQGNDIYCFPVSRDTIVFTDYNVKGWFTVGTDGVATSLQTEWQNEPMMRMKPEEYTPSEYLIQKRYAEAKAGFKSMNLNEYQISYMIYNLLHAKGSDAEAVRMLLELALEQHPNSSIVYARRADYYLSVNDREQALSNLRKAIELDPSDKNSKDLLEQLMK